MDFLIDGNGKVICGICKKHFDNIEEAVHYPTVWGNDLGVHKECLKKVEEIRDQETWDYAIALIKTKKIHCIQCTRELTSENLSNLRSDVDRTSYKCPECGLEFTVYHGEPDLNSYHDFEEEQEWGEYREAMKIYRKQLKEWESRGSPRGSRPIPPRTPEEKRIDETNLRKYGEY